MVTERGTGVLDFVVRLGFPFLVRRSITYKVVTNFLSKVRIRREGRVGVHGVAKSQARLSDFTLTFHFHALEKEMATHSSVLAWRIPGMGSLAGCRLWGRTELDTTEAT